MPKYLPEAFKRLGDMMATDSRDWGLDRGDAWLYGLFCGWDCEDDHEHDDVCGGEDAMIEVGAQHGWSEEDIARLRRYRAEVAELQATHTALVDGAARHGGLTYIQREG